MGQKLLKFCKWCNPREWGLTDNFEPACLYVFNSGQVPARLCRHKDCLAAATVPDPIEETPESQKIPISVHKTVCKCDAGVGKFGVVCLMHKRKVPDTQKGLDALIKQYFDFPEEPKETAKIDGFPLRLFLSHPEHWASKIYYEREAEGCTQEAPSQTFES